MVVEGCGVFAERVGADVGQLAQPLVPLTAAEDTARRGEHHHHDSNRTAPHPSLIGTKPKMVRSTPPTARYRSRVPELPEVETVRRGLAPLVIGRGLLSAGSHPSERFSSAADAIGRTVISVDRRGKYLMLPLDDGRRLVIHLGMTGQVRVDNPAGAADPYDRAWWNLDDGGRLALRDVRRFGRVAVLGDDLSPLPTLASLGREPFDPDLTPEILWKALRSSTQRVKTQMLAQRVVAGVGNIYADEALWRARLHPGARTVSRPAAQRLLTAIREVLSEGIEHGGTTLRDYRAVDGSTGTNQHHLDCYGRAGQPCPRCSATLRRSVVDGRGTTHCPTCQRA